MKLTLVVICGLVSLAASWPWSGHCSPKIEAKLRESGIIPDVLDTAYTEKLCVKYPESGVEADFGNELTPTQVRKQPKYSWKADKDSLYLLSLFDPDTPSRKSPTNRSWLHYLVGNIPGNNIEQGTVIADYLGSAPEKDTGLHRYVMVVYKQPGNLTFEEARMPAEQITGRGRFIITDYAKKYNLGNPVAGNFYLAQWDKTSDEIASTLHE